MIAGMTYYQIVWYFIIYAFAGWVIEVVFHAVSFGKVVNRGFLNGPVCPVYGFGVLAVFALIGALPVNTGEAVNVLYVFVVGMLLATTVEVLAGWLLDICFHAKWWDYSDKPFNLHGYICLEYSVIWGIAIVIVVKIAHPLIQRTSVDLIPESIGWWILLVCYLVLLTDLIVTIAEIRGLNKTLAEVDKIRGSLRAVSDDLTEKIAESAIHTSQILEEGKVQRALGKAETRDKVTLLIERMPNFHRRGHARILRAFPQLSPRQYSEALEDLKKKLPEFKKKRDEAA